MMKRLLCALVAIAISCSTANAGRVLVIKANSQHASASSFAVARYHTLVTRTLDALGVDYDVVPQGAVAATTTSNANHLNQKAIRNGKVYANPSPSAPFKQYAAVIHMNFYAGTTGGAASVNKNRTTGYNPDTLTRILSWPTVPQVFFGPGYIDGNNLFATTATCSTGVEGGNGPYGTGNGVKYRSVMAPGYTEVFRSGTSGGMWMWSTDPAVQPHRANYAFEPDPVSNLIDRNIKPRLSLLTSNAFVGANSGVKSDSLLTNDWDAPAIVAPQTYYDGIGDSAAIWTIERGQTFSFTRMVNGVSVPVSDSAMLIFATTIYASNGGTEVPAAPVAMAIAILDSVCNGTIIGQKPNWQPRKMAVVVSGAFTRSTSSGTSSEGKAHGVAIEDSALIKSAIDSLVSLKIPVTVTLDPDSVTSAKAYEKLWWGKLKDYVRYAYEPATALDASLTGVVNWSADSTRSPDPFGYRRTRQVDNYSVLTGNECSSTDTSLVCLLRRAKRRMNAIPEFSGKVGSFVMTPHADYIPNQYTRASACGEDTVAAAMIAAGFSCAGIDPVRMSDFTSVKNSAAGFQVMSSLYSVGGPANWSYRQRTTEAAYGKGRFRWLAYRAIDEDNSTGNTYANHDIQNEFLAGFFLGNWYLNNLNMWAHNFDTPLSLLVVRPGDLGFSFGQYASAPGWYNIKWAVNQIRLINKFAGRTVVDIGYPEDIAP